MRRLAGIGIVLLGLAGCENLPGNLRVEVDGSTLEFKKKVPPASEESAPPPVTNELLPAGNAQVPAGNAHVPAG